jgi:hypothetical protein
MNMKNDKLIHDWMVYYLKNKLSRSYDDVKANIEGEESIEYKGSKPDLILSNHGLVMAVMKVETEGSISSDKANEWKELSALGAKLILMVPKTSKAKVVDLLWKNNLVDKAAVGSYDINVNMP